MERKNQFLLFTIDEFDDWLFHESFTRRIRTIQNHHSFKPDYSSFTGSNHFDLLMSSKKAHMLTNGLIDIAQNLTTFPDGKIAVCRSFNKKPAGINGANSEALCVENIGNFNINKDVMTKKQQECIIAMNALLCIRFEIIPSTDNVVYHHWFDLETGRRKNGEGVTKACPGTNFFGGNTVDAARMNFIPLIEEQLMIVDQKHNKLLEIC